MSGVEIRLDANTAPLDLAFERMIDFGEDPHKLMDTLGLLLVGSTQDRADDGVAPDGTAWQESIRAANEGGKTMFDSGLLIGDLSHDAQSHSVEWGSDKNYAALQHFGGTIKAKNADHLTFKIGKRWSKKKEITVPARPIFGVSAEDEKMITDKTHDFMQGLIN